MTRRIAVVSDIHGNQPAFDAVLADAERRGVERLWNLGDAVVYGPFPEEVVSALRRLEATSVAGNMDRKVAKFPVKEDRWQIRKRPEKFAALAWTWRHLSESSRRYLEGLEHPLRIEEGGWRVLLAHGSPAAVSEPLYPDTPADRLTELAQMAAARLILCGHSHVPFARETRLGWFVNPGSVGRPNDGDPRASYAVLELDGGELRVEHVRLRYDVARTVDRVREAGLPEALAQMFERGRSLKWILQNADPVPAR